MSVNLYQLLKKNAPKVFKEVARKKILKLEAEIEKLRKEYRKARNEKEKEEIKQKGIQAKKELEELKKLVNEI